MLHQYLESKNPVAFDHRVAGVGEKDPRAIDPP